MTILKSMAKERSHLIKELGWYSLPISCDRVCAEGAGVAEKVPGLLLDIFNLRAWKSPGN